jgi:hypothetical protein
VRLCDHNEIPEFIIAEYFLDEYYLLEEHGIPGIV